MRCQAWVGVQEWVGGMSRMYILRISEADWEIISRTASVRGGGVSDDVNVRGETQRQVTDELGFGGQLPSSRKERNRRRK